MPDHTPAEQIKNAISNLMAPIQSLADPSKITGLKSAGGKIKKRVISLTKKKKRSGVSISGE